MEVLLRYKKIAMLLIAVACLNTVLVLPAQAKWYNVGTSSYDVFRKQTIGKEFDCDDYAGVQCVDGASVLWQQFGRTVDTGGTGMARGCWTEASARKANAGTEFELVTSFKNVKRGDVIVMWNGNASSAGHICFADENYNGTNRMKIYGQNQDGVKAFNVLNHGSVGNQFLGAFRLKKWNSYAVSVNVRTGGKLSLSLKDSYQAGATVKLAVTPEEGYAFTAWTSDQVTFKEKYSASTSFVMPAKKVWINAWFVICKTLSTEAGQHRVQEPVPTEDGFTDQTVARHVPNTGGQVIKTYSVGDVVNTVGTVENNSGYVWYKLEDGSYMFSGCLYGGCVTHTPQDDPAVEPTCTEKGKTAGSHCSVCGEILVAQQEVPEKGHTVVIDPPVQPTHESTGLTAGSHCSVCGKILEAQQVIPKLEPTAAPSTAPSTEPGVAPSAAPSTEPSAAPSTEPGAAPSAAPSTEPGVAPSAAPSTAPSAEPTKVPESVNISVCKITVKDQVYTGKALKPAVTVKFGKVKLTKGTDYTVTYKNNKAIGIATVVVKGKGNYTGSKKQTFKINPKGTAFTKLTGGNKQITLKWKNPKNITGYQIQYSLKKNFSVKKTVKIKNAKTLTTTIKKLAANKTYYVRIRTYTTVKKKNYYSAWSKIKAVKTKAAKASNGPDVLDVEAATEETEMTFTLDEALDGELIFGEAIELPEELPQDDVSLPLAE